MLLVTNMHQHKPMQLRLMLQFKVMQLHQFKAMLQLLKAMLQLLKAMLQLLKAMQHPCKLILRLPFKPMLLQFKPMLRQSKQHIPKLQCNNPTCKLLLSLWELHLLSLLLLRALFLLLLKLLLLLNLLKWLHHLLENLKLSIFHRKDMRQSIKLKPELNMSQFRKKLLIIMLLSIRLNMFLKLNTRNMSNMFLRKELFKMLIIRLKIHILNNHYFFIK